MTQSKTTAFLFDNQFLQKLMPSTSNFDMGSVLESYRKNWETMAELQSIAVQSMQSIAQCQAELLSELAQNNTTLAQQLMSEGTAEEKIARQAELVKAVYERSVSGLREISTLVNKTSEETSEILNARISESLDAMGSAAADKKQKTEKTKETVRKAA